VAEAIDRNGHRSAAQRHPLKWRIKIAANHEIRLRSNDCPETGSAPTPVDSPIQAMGLRTRGVVSGRWKPCLKRSGRDEEACDVVDAQACLVKQQLTYLRASMRGWVRLDSGARTRSS
jgi:hypothetical protein